MYSGGQHTLTFYAECVLPEILPCLVVKMPLLCLSSTIFSRLQPPIYTISGSMNVESIPPNQSQHSREAKFIELSLWVIMKELRPPVPDHVIDSVYERGWGGVSLLL